MNRAEAEAERDRLAAEHPDVTWIVGEHEGGFRVLRVGIPPVEGATGASVAAKPRPEVPDSPTSPDKQQMNPNWGF